MSRQRHYVEHQASDETVKPNGRSHADKRHVEHRSSSKIPVVNIGTWNVQTMKFGKAKDGKLENVKREMKRMKLDILGLRETRWKGTDDNLSEDIRIISAGVMNQVEV